MAGLSRELPLASYWVSALGHKQTCAVQKGTSALPPIATAKSCTDRSFLPFTLGAALLRAPILHGFALDRRPIPKYTDV